MMNTESIPLERRRHPRIPKTLHFDLHSDETEFKVKAVNLSSNGVYCEAIQPIPFMADVKIFLTLPENETEHQPVKIECSGVVVRVDKHADDGNCNGGCRIAIFFNEIGAYEQRKLDAYIAAYI